MKSPVLCQPARGARDVARLAILLVSLSFVPTALQAQEVFEVEENLDFDAPEAWALKYFSSLTSFNALRSIRRAETGRWSLGAEFIQVPHLDTEQRTVGFGGRKEEDLNRLPVWARLRASLGLPGGVELEIGWAPPVEIDGVEGNLVGLALQGPLVDNDRWSLGWRLFAQQGEADADFTCTSEDVSFAPGTPGNLFGCEAPSADTVTLDHYGAELVASWALGSAGSTRLYLSGSYQENDLEFQVNAETFGFIDRTKLTTDGSTTSYGAGVEWNWRKGSIATIGVHYAPLDIKRLGESTASSEDLVHVRALLVYRFR